MILFVDKKLLLLLVSVENLSFLYYGFVKYFRCQIPISTVITFLYMTLSHVLIAVVNFLEFLEELGWKSSFYICNFSNK